ncbi:hypothetical protein NC652_010971 [Populus alba x Populus x berolinensis]|nr:hypothetical protein NC652_010971 [Populus alba x Populus x berolinensis]
MYNPPPLEPSNPASLPSPPSLTQSHDVSRSSTLGLGLHLVPAQGMTPILTPLHSLTRPQIQLKFLTLFHLRFRLPLLLPDTLFCKSILNEFTVKVHLAKPTYNTVQSLGLLPVIVSTLIFNGGSYTGDTGRNKKKAEQLATYTVILSLPGDSGSLKILYEIIKSKRKHYAALDKVKDPSHSQPNIVHGGVKFGCSEITIS